ncbi:substrate-binding domain-containing protein [Pseudopelagicola sp. nBUS_19]|uniref:substrate-binding domain-containing protein n=1 Tax=Pseudopelagicola sp. nBUS_19 TaxID=3395316 RepID=UPI003EB7F3C8
MSQPLTNICTSGQKDFSLIGFDDIPAAAWPGHELTTIRQPIRRMIQAAVDILVAQMSTSDVPPQTPRFPGTLIVRDTVRKAFKSNRC